MGIVIVNAYVAFRAILFDKFTKPRAVVLKF